MPYLARDLKYPIIENLSAYRTPAKEAIFI
jgi:hypothetical protein